MSGGQAPKRDLKRDGNLELLVLQVDIKIEDALGSLGQIQSIIQKEKELCEGSRWLKANSLQVLGSVISDLAEMRRSQTPGKAEQCNASKAAPRLYIPWRSSGILRLRSGTYVSSSRLPSLLFSIDKMVHAGPRDVTGSTRQFVNASHAIDRRHGHNGDKICLLLLSN